MLYAGMKMNFSNMTTMALLSAALVCTEGVGAEYLTFSGISDASAGAVIGTEQAGYKILIADDEEGELRLFSPEGGKPEKVLFIRDQMVGVKGKKEYDLEGAARIGDTIYWISSHGRSAKGKKQESRYVFFGTEVDDAQQTVKVKGRVFQGMQDALLAELDLKQYNLGAASLLPPKQANAFNIEGLCASPEGWLWIGFRNPIPKGNALLVPLKNPADVIQGKKPVFGKARTLPMGGLGIRDMCYSQGTYFIVAGPYDKGVCKFFSWDGKSDAPQELKTFENGFGAEVVIGFDGQPTDKLLVLCDDGGKEIGGIENKKLPLNERTFRGVWIERDPKK